MTTDILDEEDALIGSLMLLPRQASDIARITCGAEFSDPERGRLFDVITAACEAGEPVADPTWLIGTLPQRGIAPSLTSMANVARLVVFVPNGEHAHFYAYNIRRRHLMRQLSMCAGWAATEARNPKTDPVELRASLEAKLASIDAGEAESAKPIGDVMRSAAARMAEERDTRVRVFTGIGDVDNALGPMCGGEMVVIAARPGQGKTALGLQIAWHNAERGRPALFVSLEMTDEELALRKLASLCEVDSRVARNGRMPDDKLAEIADVAKSIDAPLFVWAPVTATMTQIRGIAKGLAARKALQVVVIDYIGLVKYIGGGKFTPRQEQVASISQDCKRLAKELGCPVLVLCQLNREADGQKPMLSQLRESGAIEQDADIVLFPFRKPDENGEEDPEGGIPASIIIAKHRHGAPGEVEARWIGTQTRFANKYRSQDAVFNRWNESAIR